MSDAIWVFGYGSLVWRADFPYESRELASIEGYSRRFWQGSIDHRGVPEAPGRVVTLIRELGARCLGMAYRLREHESETVLAQLDYRERGGYERIEIPLSFHTPRPGSDVVRGIVYLATPANPNYLGPASIVAIASQIRRSCGPSGPNPEYLEELARFLRSHGAREPHVFALEQALMENTAP